MTIKWNITVLYDYKYNPINIIHIGYNLSESIILNTMIDQLAADLRIKNMELDELYNEQKKTNQKLLDLSKMKDDFLSIVSHDLRSPLNAILGFAEMLLMTKANPLDEKQIKWVNKIHESGELQLNLINDLLDISKIESGKLDLRKTDENLYDIVEYCTETMSSLAINKKIDISIKCQKKNIKLYCDKPKIIQVLNNLISNAVKFTYEGGKVKITIKEMEDDAEISIQDTGIGIPSEQIPKLFQKFTSFTNVGTKGEKGTGLGLAICKNFIEAHGGKLWVNSILGKGTTFYFTLPKKK